MKSLFRGTSAPPPGPGSGPRRTARAPRWAPGAAASGSRRSRRRRRRRRRRCNGRRRLHLLLPQRPLRRESYITRRQSLLGNVVPPGPILKGDGWLRRGGLAASPTRKPYPSSRRGREFHELGRAQAQGMRYEWFRAITDSEMVGSGQAFGSLVSVPTCCAALGRSLALSEAQFPAHQRWANAWLGRQRLPGRGQRGSDWMVSR